MLILADHHQKLIYTRAHLLPPSSPSGNDDQKSNPTFFSNMQKVHKKTDVCLGLTKLSLPTLAEVTWLSRLRCWFYARLGVTFVTSQIKGWCFDISAWLTKWNPQSQFRSTMMERIFFSTIQICFVRWCQNTVIGEKSSKGLRLITRQIYWLLLPFALGLDGHLTSSNKTKSHTHKKHYCPNTNHNQVNPYPNPQCCSSWKYEFGYLENPSFDSIPFFDVRAYNWRLIFPWSVDNCLNPPSSLEDPLCTFRNWQVWHRVSLGVTSSATDDLAPGMTWTTTTKWSWRSTEQLENFY